MYTITIYDLHNKFNPPYKIISKFGFVAQLKLAWCIVSTYGLSLVIADEHSENYDILYVDAETSYPVLGITIDETDTNFGDFSTVY